MKVRIYKSPDGNGKYLNKTGQFLEKAQKGKIVKDVLKYGKQLVMNFDEADIIKHRSAELAKAIDKFNKAERAAGAIKYGEGIKKAVTTSSKIYVKNPSYYQQLLDNTNNLSPSTRQFHNDVLKSVNNSKGMVSQKQYNILKNIENGTFNKYQLGGTPENNQQFQGSNSSQKEASLILASVYNAIKKGQSPEDVYDALLARKMDSKQATQIVTSVVDYMIENDEYTDEDAENNKKAREEEEQKYEDPNQAIEQQKDEEAENQMNQYNEQSLEVANDTSAIEQEEEDAANSSQDYLGFQYGGALGQAVKNQEQEDEDEEDLTDEEEIIDEDQNYIKEENENFTSELEKLIANSLGTQNIDYSNIGEYAIPYQPIIETGDYFENNDYENNDLNFTEEYAKYGGSSKKRFSKNVFNLLKKEEGGVQNNLEDTKKESLTKAKQTDDLQDSVKKTLTDFVGAIGMTSKKFKMDEWFKKMKEVNDPMLEQILNPQAQNDPIQDQNQQAAQMLGTQNSTSSISENQQDSMAYGGESSFSQYQKGGRFKRAVQKYFPGEILGSPKKSRNVVTRVYNPKTGQMVNLPTGDSKFDRVEVTKRNWLHQPKKYTVYYKNGNVSDIAPLVDSRNPVLNNQSQRSNVDGLNLNSKIAIRKGELGNKINNWKLKRQGLDEYGNRPGDDQGAIYNDGRLTKDREGNWYDRNNAVIPGKKRPSEVPGYYDNNQSNTNEPMSNVEMLKKQGKIWDEKLNKWVDGNIPSKMPLLPVGQIDRKPTKIISESSNNNQYNWPGYIDYNQDWIGNSQKLKEKDQESSNAWSDNISLPEDPANYGYMLDHKTGEIIKNPKGISDNERGLVWSGQYNNPDTSIDESMIWSNPASQEEFYADPGKYDWNDSYIVKNPDGTESSVRGFNSNWMSSESSPYKKNQDELWEEVMNTEDNYEQYIAEMPKHIRKKYYKELNEQAGWELVASDGSVSDYSGVGNKINEIEKRNSPYRYAPKQVPILKQYGGSLNKFLPKKVVGGPPPCGLGETLDPNTNKCVANPVFNDQTFAAPNTPIDPSITASNSGTPVIGAPINNFYANQNSFNKPNEVNVDPSLDPNIISRLPTVSTMDAFNNSFKKKPTGDEQIAIDVEKQNNKEKLTFGKNNTGVNEARIQTFNAGVDIADSIKRGIETNKAQNEMYENFSSNNLYASDPSRDRGNYDTNSGLFKPDEQGEMQFSQYGGYIDEEEYYDPYLEEDEEDELTYAKGGEKITYMSEDQIRAFMAAGGQVEFL